jgi:hypothetical protein
MEGNSWERLQALCEQAAVEEDSERLIKLVEEINCVLEEREQLARISRSRSARGAAA